MPSLNAPLGSVRTNRLTELPTQIARLRQLTTLDLCHNHLTWLPDELRHLDLRENALTALPPAWPTSHGCGSSTCEATSSPSCRPGHRTCAARMCTSLKRSCREIDLPAGP
ncbi:hypothetical protein [Flindersiella endophytica]